MPKSSSWRERFFEERRLTSKLKHLVLRPYVREFAYHLGSARDTVYYIDGFAGLGVYLSLGKPEEKGSPLLIAELAQQIQTSQKPFSLKCLNVEKVPESHRRLEAVTESFRPHIIEHNYRARFIDVIPDILQRVGNAPSFFFIDPFGTKDIPFDALRPIFQRKARTEALITFHTDGIAKKAGYFDSFDSPDPRKARLARALTSNLAAALAIPLEDLRAGWTSCVKEGNGGTEAFEQRALKRYCRLLRGKNTEFKCTKAFPVRYQPSAADASPVCFYLVFATQNETGLEVMNNVMVRALERFNADRYVNTLFPEGPEQPNERDIEELGNEILNSFRGQIFTIEATKRKLMQESTLLVRAGDYRKSVFRLIKIGKIRPLKAGPVSNESPLQIAEPA